MYWIIYDSYDFFDINWIEFICIEDVYDSYDFFDINWIEFICIEDVYSPLFKLWYVDDITGHWCEGRLWQSAR